MLPPKQLIVHLSQPTQPFFKQDRDGTETLPPESSTIKMRRDGLEQPSLHPVFNLQQF